MIAGLLLVVAWRLIDFGELRRIWGAGGASDWGERLILVVTGVATVTLSLEWAILLGLVTAFLVSRRRGGGHDEA